MRTLKKYERKYSKCSCFSIYHRYYYLLKTGSPQNWFVKIFTFIFSYKSIEILIIEIMISNKKYMLFKDDFFLFFCVNQTLLINIQHSNYQFNIAITRPFPIYNSCCFQPHHHNQCLLCLSIG